MSYSIVPFQDFDANNCSQFIFSEAWHTILKAFIELDAYVLLNNNSIPVCMLHVFKKGPFKIAYINFSLGLHLDKVLVDKVALFKFIAKSSIKPHSIRCVSENYQKEMEKYLIQTQLTTKIIDLKNLDVFSLPRIKKDLARAHKFSVDIYKEHDPERALDILFLYQETVRIKKGIAKYNGAYFEELIKASQSIENVHVLSALVEGEYAGFLVLLLDGNTAYYLHGAYDRKFNKYGITDLLLEQALLIAKDKLIVTFSLGESGNNQPQLRKFKEKWGGSSVNSYSLEYIPKNIVSLVFVIANKLFGIYSTLSNNLKN